MIKVLPRMIYEQEKKIPKYSVMDPVTVCRQADRLQIQGINNKRLGNYLRCDKVEAQTHRMTSERKQF